MQSSLRSHLRMSVSRSSCRQSALVRLPAGPPCEEKVTTVISAASLLHSSAWRISRPSVCPTVQQLLQGGQYLVPGEVLPHLHPEAELPQQTLQPPGVHLGPGPAGIHL